MIPALRASAHAQVLAIASREQASAERHAAELGIERAYGAYEALLADPDIDAVYIPLPNHLHVPWTIAAARAGKHVLCEKPIALSAAEARQLLQVREETGRCIVEAFMVRSHPRWHEAMALVHAGRIGALRHVSGHFSYAQKSTANIRSKVEWGGGALLDIGCYPTLISRWMFGAEPLEVMATIARDPQTGVDALASAILRFPHGTASFTCSGALVLHQSMTLIVDDGRDLLGAGIERLETPIANQFVLQADAFARATAGLGDVPMTLEDSIANMAVLDALFRSAESGRWESPRES
jgi:predicted dehydrogenase